MKILIITHYFPPLNKVGSLRLYSWAKYWNELGHEVRVLTTNKFFCSNLDLTNDLQIKVYECDLLFFRVLKFLVRLKKNIFNFSKAKKNYIKNSQSNIFILKFKTFIRNIRSNYIGHLFDLYDLWIFPAYKCAKKIYSEWKYDIVISSFSPPSTHVIAFLIKRKIKNIFWVADYRDLWTYNHIFKARGIFNFIQKNFERYIIRKADLLSTVSDPLAQILEQFVNKPTIVVYNGFNPQELNPVTCNSNISSKITLVYTGNIYEKFRDPTPLFHVVSKLKKETAELKKYLQIIFYGENVHHLKAKVQDTHLEDIVMLKGYLSRDNIINIQRSADILLFIESTSVDGILTGKLFEYIAARKPILAIGIAENSMVGNLITTLGVGFVAGNDETKIFMIFKELLEKKKINWFNPKDDLIKNFSREILAKNFLNQIIWYYLEKQQSK